MSRPFIALLLLAVFGAGLLAGPHPCAARHDDGEEAQAQTSSCHEAGMMEMQSGSAQQASTPGSGEPDCCDALCEHACHMTAVTAAEPVVFAIEPVAEAVSEAADPGLPLFAHAIDHIPLA